MSEATMLRVVPVSRSLPARHGPLRAGGVAPSFGGAGVPACLPPRAEGAGARRAQICGVGEPSSALAAC